MKILNWIKANPWLTCILVLGGLLRFNRIDYQSVWLDEIHTLNEANPATSIGDLYNTVRGGEQMPPLYFYTVYFLFKIFGYTTIVARMYSAFLGVLSIYVFYVFGKELFSRKVGLIAAFLLSTNYFHLYYSQESRPYIFLLLFGILSFYKLVVYLKIPTRRNAILYGLCSALMINAHFFGLFALLSQCFILLFFLMVSDKENRKAFFINALISGAILAMLFIPSLPILIAVSEIKEFWIPSPTLDAYTLIYKEFFGNSELLLALTGFMILFYFIRIAKEKDFPIKYQAILENKTIFSFTILAPWIVIVILVPLIRSYLSVPMLISRYFIILLPAILLLVASAVAQFRNRMVMISILSVWLCFSVTDIFFVKKYYKTVTKTQFREVSEFIVQNNKANEPVISSLSWYFNYFLNNDKTKMTLVSSPLEEYVAQMVQDSTKRKSFWYVDAHSRPYNPSPAVQKYLDENFVVQDGIDLNDAWAKHYIRSTNTIAFVDFSKYHPLQERNGDDINYNIEKFEIGPDVVLASGWAYFPDQGTQESQVSLVLIGGPQAIKVVGQKVKREDVTTYFKSPFDLSNSGFSTRILLDKLPEGKYQFGIQITNAKTKKEGLVLSDKFFTK